MPEINGKTIFDEDARLYDRARPDYPDELVREVMSYAALPTDGRILEIGCGPGKATCQFARYGHPMLCLEPGPNLAAVAQEKCRDYPKVQVEVVSFEDWTLRESAFELVIAASSFQWLPQEVRLPKTAAALKPGGILALFWNKHPGPYSEVHREINHVVYQQHAPELWWPDIDQRKGLTEETISRWVTEISAIGLFGPVTVKTYPWSRTYTTQEYLNLMNTYSSHRALPDDRKAQLFQATADIIARFGGTITRDYISLLYLARKL